MIRVNTDIDEYIMNDKIRIGLNKSNKVKPVSFDSINTNNFSGLNSNKENKDFNDKLSKEIIKILQKDN